MHCCRVQTVSSVAAVAVDPAYLQQPPKIKLKITVQSFINIQLKKAVMRERQDGGRGRSQSSEPFLNLDYYGQ
jgi:hypothetical protein